MIKIKGHLLFWTNVVNGLLFLFMAITGVLLKFGPPESMGTFGRGRGWWLWGMHKHEWQDWHFYAAMGLFGGIALHMLLHVAYVKGATLKYLGINFLVRRLLRGSRPAPVARGA